MNDPLVLKVVEGPVARLTLNDPVRANALSATMIADLLAAVHEAIADHTIRVIVLGAAGRVFSAGHDLGELRSSEGRAVHEDLFRRCGQLMQAIGACPKPVIAKVTGAAVAAGCQLVASCDLAYAARGARFAVSGINLGLFCSTPAVALSRKVGRAAAAEMLLTGRFIDADEAARIGLVNRAVEPDALDGVVDEAASAIANKPAEAIALGKALFARQIELGVAEAYEIAAAAMADNLEFPSAKAGIDGFLAPRAAAS